MEEGFMHSLVVFVRVVRVVGRGVEVFRVDLVGSRVGIHEDGVGLRALGGKGMGEPAVVVGERWVGTCSHEDRNHVRPLLVGSHMERSVSRLFVHNVGRRTLVNSVCAMSAYPCEAAYISAVLPETSGQSRSREEGSERRLSSSSRLWARTKAYNCC